MNRASEANSLVNTAGSPFIVREQPAALFQMFHIPWPELSMFKRSSLSSWFVSFGFTSALPPHKGRMSEVYSVEYSDRQGSFV